MNYSSLLLSSVLLASPLSFADYQFELDAALAFGSGTLKVDYGFGEEETDYDTSGSLLGATAYFGSVNTSDVPLQEAAFLSKQSYGKFILVKSEIDWNDGSDASDESLIVSGRAVIADKVILGVSYADNEEDDGDGKAIGLEGGAYLFDNNALVFRIAQGRTERDTSEIDSKFFGLLFEQVNNVGSSKHVAWHVGFESLNNEYDYETIGEAETNSFGVQAGLTFYFTNQFGVGADISTYLIEGEDVFGDYDGAQSIFMPHISYEFNENIGVYLEIESQATILEYDYGDELTDSSLEYRFGLNARF